jgi:cell division protein FtsN
LVSATPPAPAPAVIAPAPEARGLAGLLDGLTTEAETAPAAVLSDAEFRKARLAAKKREEAQSVAATEAKKKEDAAKAEAEEKKRIAAQHPARYWVQVATGANRAGLSGTVSKIRTQAKDVLKGVGSATVPYKASNRILMGPYKSEAEARATVNKLAKQGITANTFSSTAGQEVTKLSSK